MALQKIESLITTPILGLHNRGSYREWPVGAMTECRNWTYKANRLVKRRGYAKHTAQALSGNPVITGFARYQQAKQTLVATSAGKMYRLTVGTETGSFYELKTGLDADARTRMRFVEFAGYLYACNGTDSNLRWDGTSLGQMGISAPGAAPTATLNSATSGSISPGTYRYIITFVNSDTGQESSGSAPSGTVTINTGSSGKIDLSAIPLSSDSQVNGRNVYRTTGAAGTYYLIPNADPTQPTITDNTSTTYQDNTSDTNLLLGFSPENDRDVPGKFKMMVEYGGVLFGCGDTNAKSRVFYSKPYTEGVEAWPASNFLNISVDDGEDVMAIAPLPFGVAVFKRSKWGVITGGYGAFTYNEIEKGRGCIAPHSVVACENGVLWMAADGYRFSTGNIPSMLISETVQFEDLSLAWDRSDLAWAWYNPVERVYKCAVVGAGHSQPNIEHWIHWPGKQMSVIDRSEAMSMGLEYNLDGVSVELLAGPLGYLYVHGGYYYDDDGTAITAEAKFARNWMNLPFVSKVPKRAWLDVRATNEPLEYNIFIDGRTTPSISTNVTFFCDRAQKELHLPADPCEDLQFYLMHDGPGIVEIFGIKIEALAPISLREKSN